jgi:hypothetical protein
MAERGYEVGQPCARVPVVGEARYCITALMPVRHTGDERRGGEPRSTAEMMLLRELIDSLRC